jgi:hypothetical protein
LAKAASTLSSSVTLHSQNTPPISAATASPFSFLQVEDRDLDALRSKRARGCGAKAGGAAGDDGGEMDESSFMGFQGPFCWED